MGIRASNVTKSFGGPPAVDDLSIDVATGSLVALLGPSAGPGLHLAATTIRGRVLVLRLALETKALHVVACTPAPLPSA